MHHTCTTTEAVDLRKHTNVLISSSPGPAGEFIDVKREEGWRVVTGVYTATPHEEPTCGA